MALPPTLLYILYSDDLFHFLIWCTICWPKISLKKSTYKIHQYGSRWRGRQPSISTNYIPNTEPQHRALLQKYRSYYLQSRSNNCDPQPGPQSRHWKHVPYCKEIFWSLFYETLMLEESMKIQQKFDLTYFIRSLYFSFIPPIYRIYPLFHIILNISTVTWNSELLLDFVCI